MFLNPFMLFGLGAVSIPVVIHLLNRRKYTRVVWAAMRFLRISVEQNQRRIKIEDMLLLVLRCLLVALLALALARPVLRATGLVGAAKSTAVIVLDNSYSMSQTDGVQSRFEAGKKAAEEVIRTLSPGSSVAVLLASDRVAGLIPEPTFDLALASRQIKEAPLFDRATNLLPAVKGALDTLAGRPAVHKEVFLITDGQGLGWRQFHEIQKLLDGARPGVRSHVIFVGTPEERNLGITTLRVDGGLTPVNVPLRLEARVKNYGKVEARDVNVGIAVDSDPPMDQASISVIRPGEERSVSVFAKLRSEGYHTITAKIDPDHLPADDVRSVAVRAVREVRVLLVDGDSGQEARDSEVFFLKAALRPVPRSEWDNYFIKPTMRTPTELEAARFEDFDAVIAANVTDFSPGVVNQLAGYVRGGGALWVFPGENINRGFYNEQLYERHQLLPAMLGSPRGDAKVQEKWLSLQDGSHEHPIVSLWQDPGSGTLGSGKFFRSFELVTEGTEGKEATERRSDGATKGRSPEGGERGSRVVARFSDGKAAMVEGNVGLGRVVLFASTADTAWNDLGARAGVFVPLVHRTLGYLIARQDEHLTIAVGQPFVHSAAIEWNGKDALVTKTARPYAGREKGEDVRESRRIEMNGGVPMLQFGQTDFAGAYEIKVGDAPAMRFAAQGNAEESVLDPLSVEQQRALGSVAHVTQWQPGTSLREELENGRRGTELWYPLALAALILAAMETLLAHWFSRSK